MKITVIIRAGHNKQFETKQGTYNIKFRLYHRGKVKHVSSDFYVKRSEFSSNHPYVKDVRMSLAIEKEILKLRSLSVDHPEAGVDDLYLLYRMAGSDGRVSYYAMAESIEKEYRNKKQISSADLIAKSTGKLKKFHVLDLYFDDITPSFLRSFEDYLTNKEGLSVTTVSMYMRYVRRVINRAIDDEITDKYPFRKYKIPKPKPRMNMNLDSFVLQKLYYAECMNKGQEKARDLFFLSFFLCGMNFKDMLEAKQTDVHNNRINIFRSKTNKVSMVTLQPEAISIIKKYSGTEYLLSILEEKLSKAKKGRSSPVYKDVTDNTNRRLKSLCKDLNIKGISTYHARHSWATIAADLDIPDEVIGIALTHRSTVTDVYIRRNLKKVDDANRRIIDFVINRND